MGKTIKVIQNGVTTILPNNPATITRLQHFNQIQAKHRDYERLFYTIITDVSPEEEATIFPVVKPRIQQKQVVQEDRLATIERENSELKSMLLKLMADRDTNGLFQTGAKMTDPATSDSGSAQGEEVIKKGPGRPAKTA